MIEGALDAYADQGWSVVGRATAGSPAIIGSSRQEIVILLERNLARQAEKKGFNAILDFEYGQKSRFFAFDSVGLWGKGVLANIPRGDYERLRTS